MAKTRRSAGEAAKSSQTAKPPASSGDCRQDFFQLHPERVLDAVERAGLACRPLCYALNSFENRVYEVELADRSRIVAKFYRPSRWSEAQILEEHELLGELVEAELPVCAWRPFPDGRSLHTFQGLHYAFADRRAGRAPDELDETLAHRLGVFVGRMHGVASRRPFRHRPRLDADSYIRRETAFLREEKLIAAPYEARYLRATDTLADLADRAWPQHDQLRLHADLHLGNILLRDQELRVLDFDDAVSGPAVQDLWLAIPGRDRFSEALRASFLEGYEMFRPFDRASLRLIELLRGLRMVRYCAWLARRYEDPAFRLGWPDFGTEDYWRTTTEDIEEQLRVAQGISRAPAEEPADRVPVGVVDPDAAAEAELELTNKDFFWDWPGD